MRAPLFTLMLATFCLHGGANAQTPIHKCEDADGVVAYSQFPCKDAEPVVEEKPPVAVEPESLEPETAVIEPPRSSNADKGQDETTSTAACKKRYRDEIDAIDAEIRREYSPEKDGEYKQRLLALTRKLREC